MSIDIEGVMRAMRKARTHWRHRNDAKLRESAKYVFDLYVGEQLET